MSILRLLVPSIFDHADMPMAKNWVLIALKVVGTYLLHTFILQYYTIQKFY